MNTYIYNENMNIGVRVSPALKLNETESKLEEIALSV